jgi:aspartyl/asparaginyl beta-hydroxylase (cupin superfamily)
MQKNNQSDIEEPVKIKKHRRPSVAFGRWLLNHIERGIMHYSLVEDEPVFNADDYSWTSILEENWVKILNELEEVLKNPEQIPNFQDISKDQIRISKDDKWKTFFLHGYGYKMQKNCDLCPETTRIVESIPGMITAFFSVIAPGKHIPPHRGPYKGLLRCHLALIVPKPEDQCWIQVGDKVEQWQEGRCLVFDDTYEHKVQNDTDGTRVVLFLDIIRPMRFPGSWLNKMVLQLIKWHPYIKDAIKNQQAWELRIGS